ncbi:MAG: type I glutamate--ammonia ligase [Actinomycetota bacterium]
MAGPKDVLKTLADGEYEFVDLRFPDLPGQVQHFTVPVAEVTTACFDEGFGFDGSSIRGFQGIEESDMLLFPDPNTAVEDTFRDRRTLILYCWVRDPITGKPYEKDSRYIAQKAEAYLKSTGLADTSFWGPEAEFYIFDSVRFDQKQNSAFYEVDSEEAAWNSGRDEPGGNLGYKPGFKGGYFPVPPTDHFQDLRSEMASRLADAGIYVEVQHHEVGTAAQSEIDIRYGTLLQTADRVTLFKYIVKNTAWEFGKTVTFMPKPIFQDNGSGMHCHQSLWLNGKPLFYDAKGYAGLSEMARYYIGGLLRHAPSLMAWAAPTTNSYRRLVPGYEAPVNLVYSQRNRSAAIRIPVTSQRPELKRLEFRCPDASANPYLAFSAMLLAGLDGIAKKIDPGAPMEMDLYEMSPDELAKVPTVPGSLEASLAALEADHDYLLVGGVFTKELIEDYVTYKRSHDLDPVRLRPHPWEFQLTYDC